MTSEQPADLVLLQESFPAAANPHIPGIRTGRGALAAPTGSDFAYHIVGPDENVRGQEEGLSIEIANAQLLLLIPWRLDIVSPALLLDCRRFRRRIRRDQAGGQLARGDS